MRLMIFCAAATCAGAMLMPAAQASPQFPAGAPSLESQLLAAQGPEARDWIKDEAQREATSRILSEETPRNAARKFGATGSDVSKMAFLVLMAASRAADANVANLVSGVQSDDASRQDLREAQATDNVIAGSQHDQLSGGEQTAEQAQGHAFLSLLPSDDAGTKPVSSVPAPTMNLQDAMDRQNQIEDLLNQAMKRVTQPS